MKSPLARKPVRLKPEKWRKAIPWRVKLEVVIRQRGLDAETGEHLGSVDDVEFDHRPALADRAYDARRDDTVPPANDPDFIFALRKKTHAKRTSADSPKRAKVKRLRASHAEFQEKVLNRKCGQGRKPKGTIKSRNTFRREG